MTIAAEAELAKPVRRERTKKRFIKAMVQTLSLIRCATPDVE